MTFGQLLKTQTFIALIASHCEFPGSWPGSIASNLITLEPGFPVHHLTAPEASMAWIPLPGEAVAFSSIPSRGYVRLAETKTCWVWMVLKCLESHKTSLLLWFFDNHGDIGHHRISRSWTLHCHVTRFSQACCGPVDTAFLFDEFLRILRRVAMMWGSVFFFGSPWWLRLVPLVPLVPVQGRPRKKLDDHQLQAPTSHYEGRLPFTDGPDSFKYLQDVVLRCFKCSKNTCPFSRIMTSIFHGLTIVGHQLPGVGAGIWRFDHWPSRRVWLLWKSSHQGSQLQNYITRTLAGQLATSDYYRSMLKYLFSWGVWIAGSKWLIATIPPGHVHLVCCVQAGFARTARTVSAAILACL